MNLTTICIKASCFLVALVFVMGATLPSPAFAQGGAGGQGGPSGADINGPLLGGPNDTSAPPTIPNSFWDGFINAFSNTQGTGQQTSGGGSGSGGTGITLTGVLTGAWNWLTGNSGGSSGSGQTQGGGSGGIDLSLTGLLSWALGGNSGSPGSGQTQGGNGGSGSGGSGSSFFGFGGSNNTGTTNSGSSVGLEGAMWDVLDLFRGVFDNPITDGVVNLGEGFIADAIVLYKNTFNGDVTVEGPAGNSQTGGSIYSGTLQPSAVPAGGHVEVTTNPETGESYTTVYDENGNAVRSNDPRYNQRNSSGSGGASIPGASRGTVGNPFSTGDSDTTGANSDETGTNNVETQTNPYLFEYDPNSTNNNPSGDGAMEN